MRLIWQQFKSLKKEHCLILCLLPLNTLFLLQMNVRVHQLEHQQQTATTFTIINKNETTDSHRIGVY